MTSCYSCDVGADGAPLELWQRLFSFGEFHVAHAFNSSLEGWLVVVAKDHITSLAALDVHQGAELGRLLTATCRALEEVTGCEKAYLMFFAEAEGFEHLHIHVVPRQRDLPEDRRGRYVFGYLREPPEQWVGPTRMNEIATAVSTRLTQWL